VPRRSRLSGRAPPDSAVLTGSRSRTNTESTRSGARPIYRVHMLWVKFWSSIPVSTAGAGPTLDASRSSAYNARQSLALSARPGPLPRVDNEGKSTNMSRLRGSVKWFDPEKGWGFIRLEDGDEVFVHHSDIQGSGFRSLRDGAEVELDIERVERGPRARNVIPLGGETAAADPSSRAPREKSGRAGGSRGSGRSGTRARERNRAGPGEDRQDRQAAGSSPKLQTLNEQIRQRLAARFTFLR
jgi:CspA family cold shock protein